MKAEDLFALKGRVKDAVVQWGGMMIDRMLPDKPKIRAGVKRGVNNIVARYDDKANALLDGFFLMVGDENGTVDTDALVDMAADILDELPVSSFNLYVCRADIGQGEIVLRFPNGFLTSALMGDLEGFRLNREDINELKNLLNN